MTSPESPDRNNLKGLEVARDALRQAMAALQPRRVLVVSGSAVDLAGTDAPAKTLIVNVVPGGGSQGPGCLVSRLQALPFQSEVFDLVVAHDIIRDGDERFVGELRRALKPGGHLLVTGTGRYGLARWRERRAQCALVRPYRLCRRLRQRSFVVEAKTGHGLAGLALETAPGWRQAWLGLADHVSVLARLSPFRPIVRRVRFARPASAGAGVQAMETALEQSMNNGERSA